MKKIVKKIISLSMCICMMMALTVGASAANVQPRYSMDNFSYWEYHVARDGYGNTGYPVMNVLTWSTSANANGNKVTLYTRATYDDPAQRFAVKYHGTDYAPRIYSYLGYDYADDEGFTLNYDTTSSINGCTMWRDYASNRADSEINLLTMEPGFYYYRINLVHHNLNLNISGIEDADQLVWTSGTDCYWWNDD